MNWNKPYMKDHIPQIQGICGVGYADQMVSHIYGKNYIDNYRIHVLYSVNLNIYMIGLNFSIYMHSEACLTLL